MIKLNRYAVVAALAIFLSGCVAQREPAPVDEVKPVPEQPAQPQQPVPVVPTVPTIPQQPGPIEHEDQTAQPAPQYVIMTGTGRCSRWWAKCCRRMA